MPATATTVAPTDREVTMIATMSREAAAAELDRIVEERVELALADPATRARIAAAGKTVDEVRPALVAYVQRSLG